MITRCSLCPGTNNCLGPDGPEDAEVLFIGEAPGINEDKQRKVFIGRVGDEINRHYLPLAGLRRDNTCFTNAINCLPATAGGKLDSNRTADLTLLSECSQNNLYPLIERRAASLRYLVPLGGFACRAIFGEAFDLDLRHGIPQETPWGIPAFPMMHPSRGMHEPKKMLQIRTDWWRLGKFLKGTLPIRQDAYPNPDYAEATDADIEAIQSDQPLAGDTESKRNREAFCLTFSQRPGSGRLIRASHPALLRKLGRKLERHRAPILFHNWLYDWSIVEAMGIHLPYRYVVDTMAVAYHLGNLPQGLKALAFRELGMVMEDFDDLVTPFSKAMVLFYYQLCKEHPWPKPEEEMVQDDKTGLWKLYKPQGMSTKLKRFFTDYEKSPETKDVFLMWEKNWVSQQSMIEEAYGPWPGKCITHVPFEKVLYYACRDVDALIRLWPVLQGMKARIRHFSQELWRVA